METRNRCKACRFKLCLQQGMAIESVKMGRIPKKLKEKALRDYHKQQERTLQGSEEGNYYPEFLHNNGNIDDDDDDNDTETEIYELDLADPSDKRHSVSSFSSFSSSSSSSVAPQLSTDSQHDIIIIPQGTSSLRSYWLDFWLRMFPFTLGILHRSEQPLRTVDLIELTISGSNNYADHLNNNLSALRLPNVFYESFPFKEAAPDKPHLLISPLKDNEQTRKNDNDSITVSNYISDLNQKCVVDYMSGFELRYANNILPMMKYLAPRLSQPFLIYELDFEVSSFFRYLRWKMFNFYLKHTQRIRGWVERMFGIIHLGVSTIPCWPKISPFLNVQITDYPGLNATRDQMWTAVQAGIPTHVNEFVAFTRDVRNSYAIVLTENVFSTSAYEKWVRAPSTCAFFFIKEESHSFGWELIFQTTNSRTKLNRGSSNLLLFRQTSGKNAFFWLCVVPKNFRKRFKKNICAWACVNWEEKSTQSTASRCVSDHGAVFQESSSPLFAPINDRNDETKNSITFCFQFSKPPITKRWSSLHHGKESWIPWRSRWLLIKRSSDERKTFRVNKRMWIICCFDWQLFPSVWPWSSYALSKHSDSLGFELFIKFHRVLPLLNFTPKKKYILCSRRFRRLAWMSWIMLTSIKSSTIAYSITGW